MADLRAAPTTTATRIQSGRLSIAPATGGGAAAADHDAAQPTGPEADNFVMLSPCLPAGGGKTYVYGGPGAARDAVRYARRALEAALPHQPVVPLSAAELCAGAWRADARLLVMPGGRDVPYRRALAGVGDQQVSAFVHGGGTYLGLCAGGYYGSAQVEFAADDPTMAVVEPRVLGFFPGTCRGPVLPGFSYRDARGAQAVTVMPQALPLYYHGGGAFLDPERYANTQVLARYAAAPQLAAVVACHVGAGGAILTGVHPEFAARDLANEAPGASWVASLQAHDAQRLAFLAGLARYAW